MYLVIPVSPQGKESPQAPETVVQNVLGVEPVVRTVGVRHRRDDVPPSHSLYFIEHVKAQGVLDNFAGPGCVEGALDERQVASIGLKYLESQTVRYFAEFPIPVNSHNQACFSSQVGQVRPRATTQVQDRMGKGKRTNDSNSLGGGRVASWHGIRLPVSNRDGSQSASYRTTLNISTWNRVFGKAVKNNFY